MALSGGNDSAALLGALAQLRRLPGWRHIGLRAIHIDHQLRPASRRWAQGCRTLGVKLRVPVTVKRVEVPRLRGASLEAQAREVRYAALAAQLRRDEILLTAHHLEDQLETVLQQLMRGAGVNGLAAMPASMPFARGMLWRPCLELTRDELAAFVARHDLPVSEDDSNADPRFDRNFLRHEILPRLKARWPAAARVAARSAAHLGEARELLGALAELDLQRAAPNGVIELAVLAEFSAARQRNLLRHWLAEAGLTMPDARHLERIRRELPAARADAQPLVRWPGGEVRRFRGRLYALIASPAAPRAVARWRWQRARPVDLGGGVGQLRLRADPHGPIDGSRLPASLSVRFRRGGERVAIRAGGGRQSVKELLRAAGVLPWEREQVPLLYAGRRLIAVGDVYLAAAFRATGSAGGKRLRLEWVRGSSTH